jgi:hypothetical protein
MKTLLIISLLFCTQLHAQNLSSFQFRFKHNGKSFKRTAIQFGAIFQHTTAAEKVADAALFNVKIVRTPVNFYSWNGTNSPESDSLTSNGLTNYLNVNAIATGSADYSSIDTGLYASNLTTLVAHLNPAKVVLVVFNEMGNGQYYNITTPADMLPYIYCAKIAVRIGHQHGFKVADGGFMPHSLVYWTYRQMSNAHDADTTNFLNYCIPTSFQFGCVHRSNASINEQVANTEYLITQFASVGFDYFNLHLYMPFVKFFNNSTNYSTSYTGLTQVCNYLRQRTSLPFISNEFGIVDSVYTTAALTDVRKNGIRTVVYYNDPQQSLIISVIDDINAITTFGNTFKSIR